MTEKDIELHIDRISDSCYIPRESLSWEEDLWGYALLINDQPVSMRSHKTLESFRPYLMGVRDGCISKKWRTY